MYFLRLSWSNDLARFVGREKYCLHELPCRAGFLGWTCSTMQGLHDISQKNGGLGSTVGFVDRKEALVSPEGEAAILPLERDAWSMVN